MLDLYVNDHDFALDFSSLEKRITNTISNKTNSSVTICSFMSHLIVSNPHFLVLIPLLSTFLI